MKKIGKIPVSNSFLSKILKLSCFETKIKRDFPRDFVLDIYLPFFETEISKGTLIFCKDADWHIDNDLKNKEAFKYTILWVLKTKNSTLKVKTTEDKIESLDLKKGTLVAFQNCNKHTLVTEENNISCFLTIDFKKSDLGYNSKSTKLKLENFTDYIQSGNSLR